MLFIVIGKQQPDQFSKEEQMLTAVTGINWGDEGKGRVIDLLAEQADVVVRYQGGNNAGHTVVTTQSIQVWCASSGTEW